NAGLRVALGCVSAVPEVLRPDSPEPDAVRSAVQAVPLNPPSDVHGSTDYRRALAEVVAVGAVKQATEGAGRRGETGGGVVRGGGEACQRRQAMSPSRSTVRRTSARSSRGGC